MANVHDVAAYITTLMQRTTTLGLQKLVYYAQAWSLVWRSIPLFDDPIQAWKHGPVVYCLHEKHKGMRNLALWTHGDAANLHGDEADVCRKVCILYGRMTPEQLRDLAHAEDPWRLARVGLRDNESSNREIPLSSIREYYTRERFRIVGESYAKSVVTLPQASEMVMCCLADTVAAFDELSCVRPLSSIRLTEQDRQRKLQRIREHRLRNSSAKCGEGYAAKSAIATLRLEGVDARKWIGTNRTKTS